MKSKKTSGHDSINNEIIKASLLFSSIFLVTLFNKILQTQVYPIVWSSEIVTPISKFGEKENSDNDSGVTINSCFSNFFKLLLNEKYTLNNNKIGFPKGFRTVHLVLTIKTLMDKYLSKNEKLYFCFVEFLRLYGVKHYLERY